MPNAMRDPKIQMQMQPFKMAETELQIQTYKTCGPAMAASKWRIGAGPSVAMVNLGMGMRMRINIGGLIDQHVCVNDLLNERSMCTSTE